MRKSSRIKLIYARYILPPIMLLLIPPVMLIPSYRYVVGGELNEATSPLTLMKNSFDAARRVVFATAEQNAADMLFSRTVMILIIAFWLLFLLAFAVSVYSAVVGFRCILSDDAEGTEKSRTFFITLIPNRILLCITEALCIPLALFPYLLPYLYDVIWSEHVGMALMAPDALIFALISVAATVVLCCVSAKSEKLLDVDVFKKPKKAEDIFEDEPCENTPSVDDGQRERIRRILLGEKIDEENTENTDKTEDTE